MLGGILVKIWKNFLLFYLGGMGYCTLELLWRRRTHGSMFVLGGVCFLGTGALARTRLPGWLRAAAGGGMITLLELGTGLLVNRDFSVWDYRGRQGNFLGQICPLFSAMWVPLSFAAGYLCRGLDRGLERRLGLPKTDVKFP